MLVFFAQVAPSNTAVPEPTTLIVWSALAIVGIGFGLWRRWKAR
jgi:hypothetical protein